jgi:hypothetical protein
MAFPLLGEKSKMYLGKSLPLTVIYRITGVSKLIPKTDRMQKSGFFVRLHYRLVGLYSIFRLVRFSRYKGFWTELMYTESGRLRQPLE